MDHELKQRLIGAVVVTALCAIFIPMLFDDPVDNSGQLVSELSIPAPVAPTADGRSVPISSEQVLKLPDPEPLSTESPGDTLESTGAAEEATEEPEKQGRSGESLYTESEGFAREDTGATAEEVIEQPVDEAEDKRPKSHSKQPIDSAQGKPLPAEAAKSMAPKTQVRDTRAETVAKESVKVKKVTETVKPLAVKKPDKSAGSGFAHEAPAGTVQSQNEPPMTVKDDGAKAGVLQSAAKQSGAAKSLAAAVAEAKTPAATPKVIPKLVRWYVQVGSFSKKENAMSLWDSLHEQGLPASLDTVQTDKGTTYRLRVGPELDGKKAAAMKARLDKQNIKAILISE